MAARPPRPRPIDLANPQDALEEEEERGILRRLVCFETPRSIARGYGLPEGLVRRFADEKSDEIHALRRSWKEWIAEIEPLCSKTNMALFLGLVARDALRKGRHADAVRAAKDLSELFEKEGETTADDRLLLAKIQRGEFDPEKLGQEIKVLEISDIPYDHGKAAYFFGRSPQFDELVRGTENVPDLPAAPDDEYRAEREERGG